MRIRPFTALIAAVTLVLAMYGGVVAGTTEPPARHRAGTDRHHRARDG